MLINQTLCSICTLTTTTVRPRRAPRLQSLTLHSKPTVHHTSALMEWVQGSAVCQGSFCSKGRVMTAVPCLISQPVSSHSIIYVGKACCRTHSSIGGQITTTTLICFKEPALEWALNWTDMKYGIIIKLGTAIFIGSGFYRHVKCVGMYADLGNGK